MSDNERADLDDLGELIEVTLQRQAEAEEEYERERSQCSPEGPSCFWVQEELGYEEKAYFRWYCEIHDTWGDRVPWRMVKR